jgi:hypothetical protein
MHCKFTVHFSVSFSTTRLSAPKSEPPHNVSGSAICEVANLKSFKAICGEPPGQYQFIALVHRPFEFLAPNRKRFVSQISSTHTQAIEYGVASATDSPLQELEAGDSATIQCNDFSVEQQGRWP